VTAGVYVGLRFNYIFNFFVNIFLRVLFLFTIVLAGLAANVESDFKKVVAMSTLSQLGIIIFILSVGRIVLCFIHMIIHAFFKSMLFLRTGSIIMQISGSQDSRVYGGDFFSYSSLIYFFVRCFCLGGFPFFVGFYSKDLIITSVSFNMGVFIYYIFIIGCMLTLFYRLRIFLRVYFNLFKNVSYNLFCESLYFRISVFLNFFSC
jgi:NADH-ubiquinone oxidoreductase chain 5